MRSYGIRVGPQSGTGVLIRTPSEYTDRDRHTEKKTVKMEERLETM